MTGIAQARPQLPAPRLAAAHSGWVAPAAGRQQAAGCRWASGQPPQRAGLVRSEPQ